MMYPFPFYKSPSYRKLYYPKNVYFPLHKTNGINPTIEENPCFPNNFTGKHQFKFSNSTPKNKNSEDCKNSSYNFDNFNKFNNLENNTADNIEYNSTECFEIFGLKLHFDDLLIIALLFFLYQEDVKDTYLYIALILLLLS